MLRLQLYTKSFHIEPSCLIYTGREQCRSRKIIKDYDNRLMNVRKLPINKFDV